MSDTASTTFSHIAAPSDRRCRWWQKTLMLDVVLATDPAAINGGNDVPGDYLKKGADIELPAWTFILDSEAVHHVKARGFTYTLGVIRPLDGKLVRTWIGMNLQKQKATIKAAGASHLLGGSGEGAHLVRMARWIAEGSTDEERHARIDALAAA